MAGALKLVALLMVVAMMAEAGLATGHRTPITSGFGSNGSYGVRSDRFPSPLYDREDVYVFRPEGLAGRVPVIFFAPGYSNNDPDEYRGLIVHVVSRGYAVVFTPFQLVSGDLTLNEKRYDTIWEGMLAAVGRYGESFDLERVGYLGHSYGGAAIFAMALRGWQRQGWGAKGLMLFSMAPWYYFQLKIRDFTSFPAHAKLVVQVYEDDKINDHRMGMELFERINLPSSEKDFMLVRSDEQGGMRIDAGHGAPGSGVEEDVIDYYAIYRTFDGLAAYAFGGNEAGKVISLGNGAREQRFMGLWASGQPIREMQAGDCIRIVRPSLSFLFPHIGSVVKGMTTVSAASQKQASLAPESLATAWGTNFSAYPLASESGPVNELNGTVVRIRDAACIERVAPLFFVSPTQVNYMVPAGLVSGSATVSIYNADGGLAVSSVMIEPVSPALFTANGTGVGPASMSVLRISANGNAGYENPLQYDFGKGGYVASPIEVTRPGEQVFLMLFGTGLRFRSRPDNVSATIGGMPVEVLYAGPQGDWPGVDQVNLRVPPALAGRGLVEVRLVVDQRVANPVQVNLR